MLDIHFIRDHAKEMKANAQRRKATVDIDRVLLLDEQLHAATQSLDTLRAERNAVAAQSPKVSAEERSALISHGQKLKKQIAEHEHGMEALQREFTQLMQNVPNVTHADVPDGPDESSNVVLRTSGQPRDFSFTPRAHWELGKTLGVIDSERAAEVSGARFTYLKGGVALLEFALVQHVFATLTNETVLKSIAEKASLSVSTKPFVPVVPPVMIRPEVMQKMGRLEPREERYHIPSDDLYLVGSAEHTMGPMHMNDILKEEQLPLRYVGFSSAFRREAGSYGKDTKGILRVHQFDKLEMETFALSENSEAEQDFIIGIQEHLMQSLKLPYRVVILCTGDMSAPDARQVDIETWMPGQGTYRETHTSDLMTDYQARRLHIRVKRSTGKAEFVHMNDATAFAIGRTIIAIMENYQQEDGSIRVPEVLQPYMHGVQVIRG